MKAKRSRSLSPEPSSSREAKIAKIVDQSDPAEENQITQIKLLHFSDDVLLNIIRFLSSKDLMSLSLCCHLLNRVCRDRTLWHELDLCSSPLSIKELRSYGKFLQPITTSIAINGRINGSNSESLEELKHDFMSTICKNCPNIQKLIITEFSINCSEIKITDFPSTLETLSLKGSNFYNLPVGRSYFCKIDQHMPNLTTLILSDCQWLTGHSLLVLSKIPKLKELRLNSCKRLGECVAYASLATRYGFQKLEKLDLRCTTFGDSELCCFSNIKTLTHIYLEYSSEFNQTNRTADLRPALRQRIFEDRNVVEFIADNEFLMYDDPLKCRITDRSICALGSFYCDRPAFDNNARNVIIIEENIQVLNNPNLKKLVVRNYPKVTNESLKHLAKNTTNLEYLDVTGTSVTEEGVRTFRNLKPTVVLKSSFDSL